MKRILYIFPLALLTQVSFAQTTGGALSAPVGVAAQENLDKLGKVMRQEWLLRTTTVMRG